MSPRELDITDIGVTCVLTAYTCAPSRPWPLRQQMDEFKQCVSPLRQSQYWERNVHRTPLVGPFLERAHRIVGGAGVS